MLIHQKCLGIVSPQSQFKHYMKAAFTIDAVYTSRSTEKLLVTV